VGLAIGTGAGAALGLAMGLLAIRREGIYFAMISLAVAQMLYFVFLQAPFTGGEDGLQGVPRGKLFGVLSLESDRAVLHGPRGRRSGFRPDSMGRCGHTGSEQPRDEGHVQLMNSR